MFKPNDRKLISDSVQHGDHFAPRSWVNLANHMIGCYEFSSGTLGSIGTVKECSAIPILRRLKYVTQNGRLLTILGKRVRDTYVYP